MLDHVKLELFHREDECEKNKRKKSDEVTSRKYDWSKRRPRRSQTAFEVCASVSKKVAFDECSSGSNGEAQRDTCRYMGRVRVMR